MAGNQMSLGEPQPSSPVDSSLPYLSIHRRFPHRTWRLASQCPALIRLPRLSRLAVQHRSPKSSKLPSPLRKELAVEGNTTDEDSCPSSPLCLPTRIRATSLTARRYFLPKYRSKW